MLHEETDFGLIISALNVNLGVDELAVLALNLLRFQILLIPISLFNVSDDSAKADILLFDSLRDQVVAVKMNRRRQVLCFHSTS